MTNSVLKNVERGAKKATEYLTDPLPHAENYSTGDKIIICLLIAVFLALFLVLLFSDRTSVFAYWAFVALLTVVFVGFLRATGVLRTRILALGGSVAVFVGILYATDKRYIEYRNYEDVQKTLAEYKDQSLRIVTLDTRTEPARFFRLYYWLSNGVDGHAVRADHGAIHTIPSDKIPLLSGIRLEFDQASMPAERLDSPETRLGFEVDRFSLNPKPLDIKLYIRPRGQGASQ